MMLRLVFCWFLVVFTSVAGRADWTLDPAVSSLSYISIKNGDYGEINHFTRLSGGVAADGAATISIDLTSVDTAVDIRNERVQKFLFDVTASPSATVTAVVDMAALADLAVGEIAQQDVTVTVLLADQTMDYDARIVISHLAAGRVRLTTPFPVIVSADDFSLLAGLEKLREIAGLDSIQPVVPVTFDLSFNAE